MPILSSPEGSLWLVQCLLGLLSSGPGPEWLSGGLHRALQTTPLQSAAAAPAALWLPTRRLSRLSELPQPAKHKMSLNTVLIGLRRHSSPL